MLDLQNPTEIAADLRLESNPLLRDALRGSRSKRHIEMLVDSGLGDSAKLNEKGEAVVKEMDRMDAEDLAAELAGDGDDDDDD